LGKVAFLYATFPQLTETFVRRELKAINQLGFYPALYSLWSGENSWEGQRIFRFYLWELGKLCFWIPYWAWKRPGSFRTILNFLWFNPCPNLQNWNETFLGLSFALVKADSFRRQKYSQIHGIWATMPTSAALGVHLLTDIKFSMDAHAYDVFRDGGDWLLSKKIQQAQFIRTSSRSTARRLSQLGASKEIINIIKRSLITWPCNPISSEISGPLRLVSVGRLVPKKGYCHLLSICKLLSDNGLDYKLSIIGDGPLREDITLISKQLNLGSHVSLIGACSEEEVIKYLEDHDAFLFTGVIDERGDRDGIPNVIIEAMACGLLVLASNQAGASEAFVDGVSGISLDPQDHQAWVSILLRYARSPDIYARMRAQARVHSFDRFDSCGNASKIVEQFRPI